MEEKEKFSLKDALFNEEKVIYLADLIKDSYYKFDELGFKHDVMRKFPKLELKERIFWIRECLEKYLPHEYETALHIIVQALPEPLDPTQTDDDFGDFILAPLAYYVANRGLTPKHLKDSLAALGEMTKRFSVEDPIRYFINYFKKETMIKMVEWSNSDNYHQRRLASEGLRPKLPWATALLFDYREAIPVLDNLYADPTRYVTRSVANHLNDIAKDDPKLVIKTLKRWKESKKQTETEMNFIIKHSLRTLIKRGHQGSLELMGYNINPKITVKNFVIQKKKISLGKKLSFSCDIISENTASEGLIIDYRITYATKTKRASNKVFKMKQFILAPNETKRVKKDHLFKKMSTKSLHTGTHGIALIINGKEMARDTFYLKV